MNKRSIRKFIVLFSLNYGLLISSIGYAQDIHQAAQSGDLNLAKTLLEKQPELATSLDAAGLLPSQYASMGNYHELTSYIISKMSDVDVTNISGHSALFYAVYRGQTEVVNELLERNAIFDRKDSLGRYPIHYATREGFMDITEILIEKGADIKQVGDGGETALNLAVSRGHIDIAKILLKKGATYPIEGTEALNLMNDAARYGFKELVDQLRLKGLEPDPKAENAGTVILSAALGGLEAYLEWILDEGFDPNITDQYGEYPLHAAVKNKHMHSARILIKNGAEINVKRPDGKTAYHLSIDSGYNEIKELLIDLGCDQTPYQFTTLKGKYMDQDPPGMEAQVFAPGIVSTPERILNSVFSPDFNEFYYTGQAGIMCMKRSEKGWMLPELTSFSGSYYDVDMSMSPDGNQFFFCTNRPLPGDTVQQAVASIWSMTRNDQGWNAPAPLYCADTILIRGFYPIMSNNGSLYFQSRNFDGSLGASDVYRCLWKDGKFVYPENLGSPVSSEVSEGDIFIAPDESYIIVTSVREVNYGLPDLYIGYRKSDGSWSELVNMGKQINSQHQEFCPMVSPDGKYLFFTRSSVSRIKSDIYWIDAKIIEDLKPEGI